MVREAKPLFDSPRYPPLILRGAGASFLKEGLLPIGEWEDKTLGYAAVDILPWKD